MALKFAQLFDAQYLAGGQTEADANYEEWVAYRTEIVTAFVKRIKTEVKDVKGILLSTAVFSSISDSTNNKKQDWQTWFTNGWIDIATPMAYYTDASDVLLNVYNMILAAGNTCYYYAGLASSYSGLPAYRNAEQIEAAYAAGAHGYVIFCSTQILGHSDVQSVLSESANSKNGVLPHAQTADILTASFADILDKAQRIYIPAGGMTEAQYTALSDMFTTIQQMNTEGATSLYAVQRKIYSLYGTGISTYAKGYAGQRITEQLKELYSLLDTKISLALIKSGDWDPEEQAVRPTVTETEIIPYTPSNEKVETPQTPTDTTVVTPQTNSDNTLVIVLCVVGAVVVIGAAAVVIIVLKKKGKKGV
jgi:hypothetical protein